MLRTESVPRVSLGQLKARFVPRVFKQLTAVSLEFEGQAVTVEVVRVPDANLKSGFKRRLRCPLCLRTATVLGCVPQRENVAGGWMCLRCGRWRGA